MTQPLILTDEFLQGVHSTAPSHGLTHSFYKYPARFSPEFARAAIQAFSVPGDVILDPFMGGGTTLVEALASGRHAIGGDISPLAYFVTQVKTRILSEDDAIVMLQWLQEAKACLNIYRPVQRHTTWQEQGYQRGLPWRIRKLLELALNELESLPTSAQQEFVRCVLLKVGQWAIDCRIDPPSASAFRAKVEETTLDFIQGMRALRRSLGDELPIIISLNTPASKLTSDTWYDRLLQRPNLVVTSPPYPSVRVMYHRWQIQSRRQTSAPFWIANCLDGNGESYYTMGSYTPTGLKNYFNNLKESFAAVHRVLADNAFVVQLIGFSNIELQLPRYLHTMEEAGYREVELAIPDETPDRVWRKIPDLRRWYATNRGDSPSARELLLIHQRVS